MPQVKHVNVMGLFITLATEVPMDKRFKLMTCRTCGVEQPSSNFYWSRRDKRRYTDCKECNKKVSKKYQQAGYRETEKYIFYQRAYGLRRSSAAKGIPCSGDLEAYLKSLWAASHNCYYTDVEMVLTGYHEKVPNAMTVDRIDPALGYVPGNIALCCSIVNRMKQDLLLPDLVAWCDLISKKAKEN